MTWALIRRDPAVRSLARFVPICVANTLLVLGVYYQVAFRTGSPSPMVVGWILWSAAALYLGFARVDRRCNDLELTLPLSARRLWLTHVLGLVLGGGVILAVAAGLAQLAFRLLRRFPQAPVLELDLVVLALQLGSGLLLAVVLLQSGRPAAQRIPLNPARILWILTVLVGTAALVGWLRAQPIYFAVAPLAVAAAVAWRTCHTLPAAFTLVSHAARPKDDAGFTTKGWGRSGAFGRSLRITVRTVLGDVKVWANLAAVLVMGLILGGGLEGWGEDLGMLRYTYIPFVIYVLVAFSGLVVRQLYAVDPLPVSRRRVLALFVVPQLVLLLFGYATGTFLARDDRIDFVYVEREEHHYVAVPNRFWDVVPAAGAATNAAPWGESQEAGRRDFFEGGSWVLQSPISTPPGSSLEFASWQLSRAVERVYGRQIAPRELAERYLTLDEEGEVVPKGQLTLLDDYPGLVPRGNGPLFPVLFALVVPPWFLILTVFLRTCRAGVTKRIQLGVLWIFLGLLLAAIIGQFAAMVAGLFDPVALRGWLEIRMMQMGESGVTVAALWVASALVTAATFLVVQAGFERIEVSGEMRPTCTW